MNSHVVFFFFFVVFFFGKKPPNFFFFFKLFPRMKVTLPSKVASKQASKILIERQMVLLRVWLPTTQKKKKLKKKEGKKERESDAIEAGCKVIR